MIETELEPGWNEGGVRWEDSESLTCLVQRSYSSSENSPSLRHHLQTAEELPPKFLFRTGLDSGGMNKSGGLHQTTCAQMAATT